MGQKAEGFKDKAARKPLDWLFRTILGRISAEKKFTASRRRVIYFSVALFGSFIAFLLACAVLQSALVQSELLRILSLVVSNPKMIISNWSDFGLFVIESLPAFSIILFFSALLISLLLAKYAVKYLARMISLSKYLRKHQHGF